MDKEPIKDPTKTRKDAQAFETTAPESAIGYYLAAPLIKTWQEDFIDGDTGAITSVERNEILYNRGEYITPEKAASISFLYQTEELKDPMQVSDQKRLATERELYGLLPFSVVANINKKNYKFILQAQSVDLALAVARDWIELNYDGHFTIRNVSHLSGVVILNSYLERFKDDGETELISNPDDAAEGDRFYKCDAEVKITYLGDLDPFEDNFTFIVKTADIDTAKAAASAWITNRIEEDRLNGDREVKSITTTLTAAVPFTCTAIINRLFCEAYKQPNN